MSRKAFDLIIEKIFGALFLILGISGFHNLVPFINLDRFIPELHPFMNILLDSGYFYVVKGIEATAGLMLLINFRIPLALTLITPVTVNIALYHIFLDQRNWQLAPLILVMNIYLISKNWDYFRHILKN